MQTVWVSPTEFVSGDPTVHISYPFLDHPGTVVTCSNPGDFKWVFMGLRLPDGVSIEKIIVCYELSDRNSFISQVRLLEMAGPGHALVLHDDPTPLNKPSDSYVSTVGSKTPTSGRAVTLGLRLVFRATTDEVRLGAVGVGIDVPKGPAGWLAEAETLAVGFDDKAQPTSWGGLAQSKVSFITHTPVNSSFFARCHALGIRCFPYISFYHGHADRTTQGLYIDLKVAGPDLPTLGGLAITPEFIRIEPTGPDKGKPVRSKFWDSLDMANFYEICPNVQELQDAVLQWVDRMMRLGADGIFLDNLWYPSACAGPDCGKHKHMYADQNLAFRNLLQKAREMIKLHRPDGAILGNSGDPWTLSPDLWPYIDADMLESYICSSGWPDRGPPPPAPRLTAPQAWDFWHKKGTDLQGILQQGKQVLALSYLGYDTSHPVGEDAFFCYASARLAGFVWNGGLPLSDPAVASLHRLRLGDALSGELVENDVYYRVFSQGFVAVNPEDSSRTIRSPVPTARLFDVFKGCVIDAKVGAPVEIPASSGRVFLFSPRTDNDLAASGPRLTVATEPTLGGVHFRVSVSPKSGMPPSDPFHYWTHKGRWTPASDPPPNFGSFDLEFDEPATVSLEIIDTVALALTNSLGSGRDPHDPTRLMGGKQYLFAGWQGGKDTSPIITKDVSTDLTVVAMFEEKG